MLYIETPSQKYHNYWKFWLLLAKILRDIQGVRDTVFVKTPLHRIKTYAFAEIFILLPQWCRETSWYVAYRIPKRKTEHNMLYG